eukprot:3714577-Rhodomonas_salina.3
MVSGSKPASPGTEPSNMSVSGRPRGGMAVGSCIFMALTAPARPANNATLQCEDSDDHMSDCSSGRYADVWVGL